MNAHGSSLSSLNLSLYFFNVPWCTPFLLLDNSTMNDAQGETNSVCKTLHACSAVFFAFPKNRRDSLPRCSSFSRMSDESRIETARVISNSDSSRLRRWREFQLFEVLHSLFVQVTAKDRSWVEKTVHYQLTHQRPIEL